MTQPGAGSRASRRSASADRCSVIESRRAAYDLAAVREDLDRVRHPSADYLRHRLRDHLE